MDIFYHLLNHGVDKRRIFMDDGDRFRFIHDLFEFNNIETSTNNNYYFPKNFKTMDIGCPYIKVGEKEKNKKPRKLLVNILAFCLMPNHYHLLVKPIVKNGIALFMKKLNMGYAKYFNIKHKRSGALFQGKYKSIIINEYSHFLYLPYYIHLNPLDLIEPSWRNGKINHFNKALNFLENYRWSSYLDYAGQKNFPSITQRKFLLEFFEGSKNHEKQIKEWLQELAGAELKQISLE